MFVDLVLPRYTVSAYVLVVCTEDHLIILLSQHVRITNDSKAKCFVSTAPTALHSEYGIHPAHSSALVTVHRLERVP